jgi:sigma-B regulation protein RsbU (phosphoserine phosphatase)
VSAVPTVKNADLESMLASFRDATGSTVSIWTQADVAGPLARVASAPPDAAPPPVAQLPRGVESVVLADAPGGGETGAIAVRLPVARRAWLVVGPARVPGLVIEQLVRFLVPVVRQMLQSAVEVEHAATELAERYEEINLLYTISEILGRTVLLEETAATILTEISETVGAGRASILVHDRVTGTLQAVAAYGVRPEEVHPIAVDDPCSVSARVFRECQSLLVDGTEMPCDAEAPYRRGMMLSVPIMWTAPDGGQPLGVVNLSDRSHGTPFSAGDQKLVAAIATQIGTAIQNARLIRASLAQHRLIQEMELAHDLQMRLLPAGDVVAPEAEVAARIEPAESVGGDFYNLFRLPHGCTGAMIGDVSSHGYRAALIMALAMSASAIHAQTTNEPSVALANLLKSLGDELTSTEMFITVFYGIVDGDRGELRYANTGHPHAFIVRADGSSERLAALDPPLGMVDHAPLGAVARWSRASDLLLLFTDGMSDARDRAGTRLGEEPLLEVVRDHRARPPAEIVARVFERLAAHTGGVPARDDLALVVLRS